MWKCETVLGYLTSFIERSNIIHILKTTDSTQFHNDSLTAVESLGYYSIVGLCRLHCLLGDYRLAVQVLAPIDVDDKRGLFTRVTASHVTLLYYLGFAYLMMKRYSDAVDTFAIILLAHSNNSKNRTACFADSQITNKYDKICALAAMAQSLSPGLGMDEQVRVTISEKYAESQARMVQRDHGVFADLFHFACPKFITPAPPDYQVPVNHDQDAYQLQVHFFFFFS